MRYLKQLNLNRRTPNDTTLYSDVTNSNVYASPTGRGSFVLPSGTDAQVPSSPVNGMMRYNTDNNQVQVYQSGSWRNLRFNEPGKITQQNLGAGDSSTVYFGPLNPSPASYVSTQSGMTWDVTQMAKNVLVIVENVIQLSGANYSIVQNPTIGSETYVATNSVAVTSGSSTIYFNTSLNATGASGNGTTVTLTFTTQTAVPFAVGSNIVVTGFTPTGYNGTFVVTASSTSSVSYANTTSAAMTFAGNITSSNAVYPAVNITGATVTGGADIQSSTTVVSYTTDPYTDALVSITLSKPTITGTIALNTSITIAENSNTASGYYLYFSSPPPYGKTVTALIGFDQ